MAKRKKTQKENNIKKSVKIIKKHYTPLIVILAVLIVFIVGLFITGTGISGFLTAYNGTTTVVVAQGASIVLDDGAIDIGTCTPNASGVNLTSNQSTVDEQCTGGVYPDYMLVRNNGNLDINISVIGNFTAAQFLSGSTPFAPEYAYGFINESDVSGCDGVLNGTYEEFDTSDQLGCANLTYVNTQGINLSVQMFIPADATAGTLSSTIQFTGTAI